MVSEAVVEAFPPLAAAGLTLLLTFAGLAAIDPRLTLAALLVEEHRPDEAAVLVTNTLAASPAALDPWVYYQYPHFRLWPGVMTDLRRVVRR